jgi:ribosomal protein S18 acetylase RimI-like enzyme
MLSAAHAGHLPSLRAMIRAGAAEGSFDRELAAETPEVTLFFANLRQALVTGYFVEQDFHGNGVPRAAPGYVYWPGERKAEERPVGFGLFKAFADFGYELWLTGVDTAWRGNGHGRAMLASLLATPAGRLAWTVRVQQFGAFTPVMKRLLAEQGYEVARESKTQAWFLRNDAPQALVDRMRGARIVSRATAD